MAHEGIHGRAIAGLAAAASLVLCAPISSAAQAQHLHNGITVTVHTPDEIRAHHLTSSKAGDVLVHPAGGSVRLAAADRSLHPFEADAVLAALAAMHGFATDVDVDVFILDAYPAEVGGSFARRGAIFLAPGSGPVATATVAAIVTHEMGHVLTWAFLDDHRKYWTDYLTMRGLDGTKPASELSHADRPREILAEDIRFLFGGPDATRSGTIENRQIAPPHRVAGLEKMLAGFFAAAATAPRVAQSRAFPNPCNPRTTVELVLPTGVDASDDAARLRIFDVRGSLVRTVTGRYHANGRIAVVWDGYADDGTAAASGRYLYVISAGGLQAKGAVTLVR